MVDSIIICGDIHGEEAVYIVAKPKIGGLLVDETINDKEKWVLIPFSGSDHDATTNVWIYYMDKKTWIIDEVNKEWGHNKGVLHDTQYCPIIVKGQTTARANCNTFVGTDTISNPEDKGAAIPLNSYKDTCWCHMILHGMWDVFSILDPFIPPKLGTSFTTRLVSHC